MKSKFDILLEEILKEDGEGMSSGPSLDTSINNPSSKDAVYGLWSDPNGFANVSGKKKKKKRKTLRSLFRRKPIKENVNEYSLEELEKLGLHYFRAFDSQDNYPIYDKNGEINKSYPDFNSLSKEIIKRFIETLSRTK